MKGKVSIVRIILVLLSVAAYAFLPFVALKLLTFTVFGQTGIRLASINTIMIIPYILGLIEIVCLLYGQRNLTRVFAGAAIVFAIVSMLCIKDIMLHGNYGYVYDLIQLALPIIQKIPFIQDTKYAALLTAENADMFLNTAAQFFISSTGFWTYCILQFLVAILPARSLASNKNKNQGNIDKDADENDDNDVY